MKKFILILYMFILVFSSYAEELNKMSFNIVLKREGFTDYYFAEKGSTTRKQDIVFSLITNNGSVYRSTESARFCWEIYEVGTYNISLVFKSDVDGYMLGNVVANSTSNYNYSVSITGSNNLTEIPKEINVSNSTAPLVETARTIELSGLTVSENSESKSNIGYIDMDFSLTSNRGFIDGQYQGKIEVYVDVIGP